MSSSRTHRRSHPVIRTFCDVRSTGAFCRERSGQFYGNHYTWEFADGWKQQLDTPGSAQVGYLAKLFAGRPWFRLVPDQGHRIVTAGYGTFASSGNVESSNYVTTAATPDGRLAISYLPAGGTINVDMARFAGPVRARWYDPTRGVYSAVSGSPFPQLESRRPRLTRQERGWRSRLGAGADLALS